MTDPTAMTADEIEVYVSQVRSVYRACGALNVEDDKLTALALRLASVLRENERLRTYLAGIGENPDVIDALTEAQQ